MKTIRVNLFAAFLAVGLTLGLATSALAGPGPQYWAQQHARAVAAAEAKEQSKMACPKCKDTAVTSVQSPIAGGKGPGRTEVIGAKHACAACGGEIKSVHGKTTTTMQSKCPFCAQTAPSCCKVTT